MKPYKVEIYLYAESEEEVAEAKKAAQEFVVENYQRGVIITALGFANILRKFKNNPLLTHFLK